VVLTVISVCCG